MEKIFGGDFTGERALFCSKNLDIRYAHFFDGESPLKESENIELTECRFSWKYPLWYCKGVKVERTLIEETARSGIWYTHGITMIDCTVDAPKTFRRSSNIELSRVVMKNAQETLWNCSGIKLSDVTLCGDYFGFGSSDVCAENLDVVGNYLFDGGKNIRIKNSRLISKDAFWNCEDVVVENCTIVGEYLGWNSKNVRFINCIIDSNQGMCYMDDVVLENCDLGSTDLCFEYCTVQADINSHVVSVKNPISGRITAPSIGEIIHDGKYVDVSRTEIIEENKNV